MNINNNNGGKIVSTVIVVLILALSALSYYCYNMYRDTKAKLKASESNKELLVQSINTLQDSCKTFKVKIGENRLTASSFNTIYLDKKNLKSQLSDKIETINKLGIDIDRLESAVSVKSTTSDTVHTIAYVDSIQSLHSEYKDSFVYISTTIKRDNSSDIWYSINDEFDLYNHRVHKHKFLFIKWGTVDKFILIPRNPKSSGKIRSVKVINS